MRGETLSERDGNKERATAGFAGGQAGAVASASEAAGAEAMRTGMDELRSAAADLGKRGVEQAKGNLFEYVETTKLNAELAESDSIFRAIVSAADGRPHAPSDIDIYHRATGEIVEEVQAKAGSASYVANVRDGLSNEKYQGMQRLTAVDMEPAVRAKLEQRMKSEGIYSDQYRDTLDNLTGELECDGARSGGTTLEEAREAVRNPKTYALKMEMKAVGRQAAKAGAAGAATGGVLGGGIAACKNAYAVYSGDMTKQEAAVSTAKEAGKSAAKGGTVAASGSMVSHIAAKGAEKVGHQGVKCGMKTLSKNNVATAVASALVEIGGATYELGKGQITAEQYVQRIGRTGTATLSGMYTGAAVGTTVGAVAGPAGMAIGSVVGSVAGYMTATLTYESVIGIFQEADLAEEEAERLMELACEAVHQMELQRREFEAQLDTNLADMCDEVHRCFDVVDAITLENDHSATVGALTTLAGVFGKSLQFERFEDFDSFMMDPNSGPLVL